METTLLDSLKRTLYLAPKNDLVISADGPSILVSGNGSAARRFPLRLLRQVVVQGPVCFPSAIIEQCLRAGVSVTWMENSGDPLGFLWPARLKPATLNERMEVFWERQDWHWKYENWRRAQERLQVKETLTVLQVSATDLRPVQVERLVIRLLARRNRLSALPWRLRFLRGFLLNDTQAWFQDAGVTLENLERRTTPIQLPEDFMRLLFWSHLRDLHDDAPESAASRAEEIRRECADFVERRRPASHRRFIRLLDRFDFFLGSLR